MCHDEKKFSTTTKYCCRKSTTCFVVSVAQMPKLYIAFIIFDIFFFFHLQHKNIHFFNIQFHINIIFFVSSLFRLSLQFIYTVFSFLFKGIFHFVYFPSAIYEVCVLLFHSSFILSILHWWKVYLLDLNNLICWQK